jgi:steroid delta-isomerase-like uncharacterized protein
MSETNINVFKRWMQEVWTEGREATIDELCSPAVIAYGLGDVDPVMHGPAEFKTFWRNLRGTLTDLNAQVEDMIADGDKVVGRFVMEGVHSGESLGVPASGRRVRFAGIVVIRVANGQIAEAWNSWDQLGLLRQIGALDAPGQDRFMTARP